MQTVSIIIPTYNRAPHLEHCLTSVTQQSYSSYEVIVVDDGSTDDTQAVAKKFPVKYIRQRNSGPAVARNTGAKVAKGSVFAFTDDDCIVDKHWIRELVKPCKGKVGIVGGFSDDKLTGVLRHIQYEEPDDSVEYFQTNNIAVSRKAFEAAGGFNPLFDRPGQEDMELCINIRKKGYELVYWKAARIRHNQTIGVNGWIRQNFNYGYGNMIFQHIHGETRRFCPHLFAALPVLVAKRSFEMVKRSRKMWTLPIVTFLNFLMYYHDYLGRMEASLKLNRPSLLLYNPVHKAK